MTTLVVGASGATGRLLVEQLLERGQRVKIVVRSIENLPEMIRSHTNVSLVHASILELGELEQAEHVRGCDTVVSCLGHNLSLRGLYGPPYRLVTDAVRSLCTAIKSTSLQHPVKLVLMNTTGNRNRDLDEEISLGQKCVIWFLRMLLPPHVDNEKAADSFLAASC